jgi:formate dehydrogenase subunit gamma
MTQGRNGPPMRGQRSGPASGMQGDGNAPASAGQGEGNDGMRSWDRGIAAALIESHRALEGAMLPILHALQEEFGYIDAEALPLVADALNVSRAEVHGVVTFYHDFREAPAGRHVLKLCRAEACQSVGCDGLADHLAHRHGLAPGETTADGTLTVENTYCLGNCALGPAAMLDGDLIGRLDADRLDAIVARAKGALS